MPRIYFLEQRALSKHQSLRAACWAGYIPRNCPGSTTAGRARREGTDQLESEMEGIRSVWTLSHSRFKSCTYPDVAGIAPSSRGLSAASLLSWTGPPAPAGLATKPKARSQASPRLSPQTHRTGLPSPPRAPFSWSPFFSYRMMSSLYL